ncbi:MAG: hypothetical protein ACFFFC_04020 [Candidatus Thorarchaeota archaeon]
MNDADTMRSLHDSFRRLLEIAVGRFESGRYGSTAIFAIEGILRNSSEMKQTIELIREAAAETRQLEVMSGEGLDAALSKVISRLVTECFLPDGPPEVNRKNLECALEDLNSCSSVKIPLGRFWCYVQQLEMDDEIIDIDGPLRLRKATPIERAHFISQGLAVGGRTEAEVIAETMPTTKTSKSRNGAKGPRQVIRGDILPEFDLLVSALRLLSPSSVGVNQVTNDESPRKGMVVISLHHNTRPDVHPAAFSRRWNAKCILNHIQRKLLIKLHRRLRKAVRMDHEEVPRLLRSLRRYNRAICNDFIEDEVIDLSIILETIVRAGGEEMASRIATITSTSDSQRAEVEMKLKRIHRSVRGPLVHGASFESKNTSLINELLWIASNALRAYLILFNIRGGLIDYIIKVDSSRQERNKLNVRLSNWLDSEQGHHWNDIVS